MGIREDEKIAPHCDYIHVHEQTVKQVLEVMPTGDTLVNLAEFFRGFCRLASPDEGMSALENKLQELENLK